MIDRRKETAPFQGNTLEFFFCTSYYRAYSFQSLRFTVSPHGLFCLLCLQPGNEDEDVGGMYGGYLQGFSRALQVGLKLRQTVLTHTLVTLMDKYGRHPILRLPKPHSSNSLYSLEPAEDLAHGEAVQVCVSPEMGNPTGWAVDSGQRVPSHSAAPAAFPSGCSKFTASQKQPRSQPP